MLWLEEHNLIISFTKRTILFNSSAYYKQHYYARRLCLITVDTYGRTRRQSLLLEAQQLVVSITAEEDIYTISIDAFLRMVRRNRKRTYRAVYDPRGDNGLFILQLEDLRADEVSIEEHVSAFIISPEDIEKFIDSTKKTNLLTKLPQRYYYLANAFRYKTDQKMPEHGPSDYAIVLKLGEQPPFKRGYAILGQQLSITKKYINDELAKGTIKKSDSPYTSLILIIAKPSGGLRVYVDYRALNALIVKDRYPIPLIRETLDRLYNAKQFTKLNIVVAFNNLRIRKGDEQLIAFITRYGLYQYKVMPFRLYNGLSSQQRYVNDLLRDFLDDFIIVYLDDILIYTDRTKDKHVAYVKKVLLRLISANLPIDIDKYDFYTKRVKYLRLIMTTKGIKIDLAKVEAVQSQEKLKNVIDVLTFLGFTGFYRRFIYRFSSIVRPLIALSKNNSIVPPPTTNATGKKSKPKKVLFVQTEECQ